MKQNEKLANSKEITERYLKKLNSPTSLTGEQIWKLFKGDGTGEEISIDFIKEYCDKKQISLDLDKYDRLFLADNEKALRNMKNTRKDNTSLIDLSTKLKQKSIPTTQTSFKYNFEINSENFESNYKSSNGAGIFESNILAIGMKGSNNKYELIDTLTSITGSNECILVLDKTIFYPESGGQVCDQGEIEIVSSDDGKRLVLIQVDNVQHVQGYTFHSGKIITNQNDDTNYLVNVNQPVRCKIDERKRYEITMNHTGVHLINHAIRSHYKNETSIKQVNSIVKDNGLKFEFSFNQTLSKPDLNAIKSFEEICKSLINKSMPIYTNDNVNLDDDTLDVNNKPSLAYPLRKLHDVLYPLKVRIVSIGTEWNNFFQEIKNEDYSAELCCGTHATNTNQLKDFVITHFGSVGDSTFEIDACTSKLALETRDNDRLVESYLNEMIDLFKLKQLPTTQTTNDLHKCLNQLSDRSIRIENIFKSKSVSYTTLQFIKKESVKYRPTKNLLQNVLKKYFQEELIENKSTSFISNGVQFKYMEFESVLFHDQIINILRRLDKIDSLLILYNKYRSNLFIYSSDDLLVKHKHMATYLNELETKILNQNFAGSSLLETKLNYRVIKSSSSSPIDISSLLLL